MQEFNEIIAIVGGTSTSLSELDRRSKGFR